MTKTILKWAGNKSKVMDKIGKLFPNEYERYLEPLIGTVIGPQQPIDSKRLLGLYI